MTQRDSLACVHEPLGDPWYFGPERLGLRYLNDEKRRIESGFSDLTYQAVFNQIKDAGAEGKRAFIKEMAYCFFPPNGLPATIAPSLSRIKRGVGTNHTGTNGITSAELKPYPYDTKAEPGNPTIVPETVLQKFHFAFLIRHPRSSVPSYYRCCTPPLNEITGFHFMETSEIGYAELRRLFDYLRGNGQIGPKVAGRTEAVNGESRTSGTAEICVIDADDLLDNPAGIIEAFCKSVGIKYDPGMLEWDEVDQQHAREAFAKWKGFHDDAIKSTSLRPRQHVSSPIGSALLKQNLSV